MSETSNIMIFNKGFSYIELIIFIVILGILATGLLLAINQVLRGGIYPEQNLLATRLAQERTELILEQRYRTGFASFTDPCDANPSLAACTLPGNYSISKSITTSADPNFKTITVQILGLGRATLITQVANY